MQEAVAKYPHRLAIAVKWLAVAALIVGTVIPKTSPDQGTIVGQQRWYWDTPADDYYDEEVHLTEAGWFNRGFLLWRTWEHRHGRSGCQGWLWGSYWGWLPGAIALLLAGMHLSPSMCRPSLIRMLRSRITWLLFGVVWLGSQLWMAYSSARLLAEKRSDEWALFSLLLFLALNGAILLFAMDGRRSRWTSAVFWFTLRGWAQSYLVYLTVIALLLWRQGTWPSLGLPAAVAGAALLWVYLHLRIRYLQRLALE